MKKVWNGFDPPPYEKFSSFFFNPSPSIISKCSNSTNRDVTGKYKIYNLCINMIVNYIISVMLTILEQCSEKINTKCEMSLRDVSK